MALDGLLETSLSDDEVLAVLCHGLGHVFALRFSRDDERAADALAVRFMRENDIPAAAFVAFFERLEQWAPTAEMIDLLATHPATKERIDTVRALANAPL